jgi:hypothetical protein
MARFRAGERLVRAALAFLVLTGCASAKGGDSSEYAPAQLMVLTTHALCKPYIRGENVAAERQRRGLSDCSPADQACASATAPPGTPGYAHCRTQAMLPTNSQCYFDSPAVGRLRGPSNTDLICSQGSR